MGFPSSTHQDIHVLRTSKMKTRPWTLRLSGDWLSGSCSTTVAVCWACSSGLRHVSRPAPRICALFSVPPRMSLQNVSQVISRPASESRCQICLCVFPERSATSISNKREQRRAVFGRASPPVMKEDHHRPVSGHVVVNRHNVETVLAQRGEEDMTPPCWIR